MSCVAIIGGSGFSQMPEFQVTRESAVETPFGVPSAPLKWGYLNGVEVVFLARHGVGHTLSPSHVNYRANVWALKSAGVKAVFSVSAVGSLKEEIAPGHMVVVDQFIDMTKNRISSFFGDGLVAHVGFAHPISRGLSQLLIEACQKLSIPCHHKATYLCIEGPQFSTLAESRLWRQWGADVIGMTNATEAKLCREAEIDYATLALSTDYDCWHPDHDSVTTEQILAVLSANVRHAQKIMTEVVTHYKPDSYHDAAGALKNAVLTARDKRGDVKKWDVLLTSVSRS